MWHRPSISVIFHKSSYLNYMKYFLLLQKRSTQRSTKYFHKGIHTWSSKNMGSSLLHVGHKDIPVWVGFYMIHVNYMTNTWLLILINYHFYYTLMLIIFWLQCHENIFHTFSTKSYIYDLWLRSPCWLKHQYFGCILTLFIDFVNWVSQYHRPPISTNYLASMQLGELRKETINQQQQ